MKAMAKERNAGINFGAVAALVDGFVGDFHLLKLAIVPLGRGGAFRGDDGTVQAVAHLAGAAKAGHVRLGLFPNLFQFRTHGGVMQLADGFVHLGHFKSTVFLVHGVFLLK